MPGLAPAVIAALIGAAGTATEAGIQLAGVGQPSPNAGNDQIKKQEQLQAQQDQQAKQKAITANLANSQEQTGGNVNNPGLVDLAAIIAGLPGESGTTAGKGALSSYLGTPTSSTDSGNLVSSTYGLNGSQG